MGYSGEDRRKSGIIDRRKDDFVCVFHDRATQEYDRCFSRLKNNLKEIETEMKDLKGEISKENKKLVPWVWFYLICIIAIGVFSGTVTLGGFVARDLQTKMTISDVHTREALNETKLAVHAMALKQSTVVFNQDLLMKNQKALMRFFDLEPESAVRRVQ